jgi:3-mercaptopyruvate sulfurtransferase SseA
METVFGVKPDSSIVLYDTSVNGYAAPRGWYTFLSMGHRGNIRVLNGGFKAWKAAGFDVETGPHSLRPSAPPALVVYDCLPKTKSIIDIEEMISIVSSSHEDTMVRVLNVIRFQHSFSWYFTALFFIPKTFLYTKTFS